MFKFRIDSAVLVIQESRSEVGTYLPGTVRVPWEFLLPLPGASKHQGKLIFKRHWVGRYRYRYQVFFLSQILTPWGLLLKGFMTPRCRVLLSKLKLFAKIRNNLKLQLDRYLDRCCTKISNSTQIGTVRYPVPRYQEKLFDAK